MDNLKEFSKDFLNGQTFDALAVGIIDFSKKSFESFELEKGSGLDTIETPEIFFDLASVSKPLTNGVGYLLKQKEITEPMNLVLNHRGGLPAWGLLPKNGWQDIICGYSINESETLYSDYSALRFMLEFNKNFEMDLHTSAADIWDKDLCFWKDLKKEQRCIQNGYKAGKANYRSVHDPNAYTINDKVSHAGLFATIDGVCKTLLNINEKLDLLDVMTKDLALNNHENRFVNGWDRATDLEKTLAGKGCSEHTFGHLGFTGTSVWIDSVKKLGHVILSNATKYYWYDKTNLNDFRREIGAKIWEKGKL